MTMVEVELNGERTTLEAGTSVAQLVSQRSAGREGRGLAVAVNEEVVPRSSWPETLLRGGDRVELLNAVGGG